MKRWRWNQMKRPLPTLIVAIQGTSLIIRNLPFVQFPPKADRGPSAVCPVMAKKPRNPTFGQRPRCGRSEGLRALSQTCRLRAACWLATFSCIWMITARCFPLSLLDQSS
jgi:hypothetical protein